MKHRGKLGLLILVVLSCTGFVCSLPPAVSIYRESKYPDAELIASVATWASTNGFVRLPSVPDTERRCPDCVFWENEKLRLHLSVTKSTNDAQFLKVQLWSSSQAVEPLADGLVTHLSATFKDIKVGRK